MTQYCVRYSTNFHKRVKEKEKKAASNQALLFHRVIVNKIALNLLLEALLPKKENVILRSNVNELEPLGRKKLLLKKQKYQS